MNPPEWVEAGAMAILGEEATSTSGYYASSYRVDMEHCHDLAREVIAAVEPLLRRQIVADIEASLGADPHWDMGEDWARGYAAGTAEAIRITLPGGGR